MSKVRVYVYQKMTKKSNCISYNKKRKIAEINAGFYDFHSRTGSTAQFKQDQIF
jgi:hypothetical protein